MTWGNCFSGSNNIHFDYPPLMSDGRTFSTFLPGSEVNKNLREKENITSNWDYRQYLIHNGDKIMEQNSLNACDDCGYCPAQFTDEDKYHSVENEDNIPFFYNSYLDENAKSHFTYRNSDLKEIYVNRQQLNARLNAPILTQAQYLERQLQKL